jgi:hypothetical protein
MTPNPGTDPRKPEHEPGRNENRNGTKNPPPNTATPLTPERSQAFIRGK